MRRDFGILIYGIGIGFLLRGGFGFLEGQWPIIIGTSLLVIGGGLWLLK